MFFKMIVGLALALFLSSCLGTGHQFGRETDWNSEERPLTANTKIYLSANSESRDGFQIWRADLDGSNPKIISRFIGKYPISAFPSDEQAFVLASCGPGEEKGCLDNQFASSAVTNLALSPSNRWLAWIQRISLCKGSSCDGFDRVFVLDLSSTSNVPRMLLEVSRHVPGVVPSERYIENLTWSPDSQNIGMIMPLDRGGPYLVQIVDIETSRIREFRGHEFEWEPTGKSFAYSSDDDCGDMSCLLISGEKEQIKIEQGWKIIYQFKWSSDGKRIALIAGDYQKPKLYIVEIPPAPIEAISPWVLDDITMDYGSIVWSPDGNKIAYTAKPSSEDEMKLYIYNIVNKKSLEANLSPFRLGGGGFLKWSPSGEVVGIDTYPNVQPLSNGIAFVNPVDGLLVAHVESIDAGEWHWSARGDAVLLRINSLNQYSNPVFDDIGIYFWKENRLKKLGFRNQLTEGLFTHRFLLVDLVW